MYAEDNSIIVCGRDDGIVELYNRKNGSLTQQLHHDPVASAQTIAVRASFVKQCTHPQNDTAGI